MSKFKIGGPGGGGGGSGFNTADHEDHLLACIGITLEEQMQTRFGLTDAARVETIVCMDEMHKYEDSLLFGAALVPRLTDNDNDIVVCRFVKGEAKAGQNPPWIPEDGLDIDVKRVEEFMETYATQLRSGHIVVEMPEDAEKF
jgi:hypothetical protein